MDPNENKPGHYEQHTCFRPDGSFDFHAFITESRVVSGIITIIIGLALSFVVSNYMNLSRTLTLFVTLFLMVIAFSGAQQITKYFNEEYVKHFGENTKL